MIVTCHSLAHIATAVTSKHFHCSETQFTVPPEHTQIGCPRDPLGWTFTTPLKVIFEMTGYKIEPCVKSSEHRIPVQFFSRSSAASMELHLTPIPHAIKS